jgi:Ketopantoate reductase PanE/ApbA
MKIGKLTGRVAVDWRPFVGAEVFILRKGDTRMAPRDIPHQLRNSGNAENHYLLMFSASGFEGILNARAIPAPALAVAPTARRAVAGRKSMNSPPTTEFFLGDWSYHARFTEILHFWRRCDRRHGGDSTRALRATVSVVARGQTLRALHRHGVRLIINGEMLQASLQITEDPSELGVQDYVIIAVKAPSLPDIARRIGPLLGPETAVVTAMNGVPWWFLLNAKGVLAGHN